MKTSTKLWIGIGILAVLSPIGLYFPAKLKADTAWGEWSADEIKNLLGFVPAGIEKLASLWHAIMPDYAFTGWARKGLGPSSLAYIIAAVLGIGLCAGIAYVVGKILARKDH